jgi:hypothetical protein
MHSRLRGILVRPLKTPRGVAPDDVHHLRRPRSFVTGALVGTLAFAGVRGA